MGLSRGRGQSGVWARVGGATALTDSWPGRRLLLWTVGELAGSGTSARLCCRPLPDGAALAQRTRGLQLTMHTHTHTFAHTGEHIFECFYSSD